MADKILLFHSNDPSAQSLVDYFTTSGAKVWLSDHYSQAVEYISSNRPQLVIIDIHMPGDSGLELINDVRRELPDSGIIITSRHPDLRGELLARERGVHAFLREPFTPAWIRRTLEMLSSHAAKLPGETHRRKSENLPQVRFPMRLKITLPYVILAFIFASAATYLVSRYILESLRDRFNAQLIDAGKLSSDWMVKEEQKLLEIERHIANTQGIDLAIQSKDADLLRLMTLPLAINYQVEAIEIIDLYGDNILSLHHVMGAELDVYEINSMGGSLLAEYSFVQRVLNREVDEEGDKFSGLVQAPWGNYLYITGPVYSQEGEQIGIVAVGKTLESIVHELRADTLAHISIYHLGGIGLASTLLVGDQVESLSGEFIKDILNRQDGDSPIRELSISTGNYSEILGPWEVRAGQDLGVLGVSLARNFLARPTLLTRFELYLVVFTAFIGVIIMGLLLAHQITDPLSKMVHASVQVAQGNFGVKVPSKGNDEVMVLAHAFNYMVSGLQEGMIYRDLLGRTVSPEVRDEMRQSFAAGDLRLEGHNVIGTVLMTDIRSFSTLSEREEPATVLRWLNEYFTEMVPVITSHGGVVDKFEGDSILAFFGILPKPLDAQQSAYEACRAATELLAVIQTINQHREKRGEEPLNTGIGINTGRLTAGGLGAADRLNYTVIGDTVNTAQRLQEVTRDFGESGIVINESTLFALAELRREFDLESLGEHSFKGKRDQVWLYRLLGVSTGVDSGEHG